ncbi:MAG: C10 family peptidase [Planctomycetota bacterium]
MQFIRKSIVVTGILVVLQLCSSLWARPTTAYEAEMVVTGWLQANPSPLDTTLGRRVIEVETFTDERGETAYYIVYLQPSGFVIVSADDLVEPIIGFADDGVFDPSLENPLGALVTNDLNGRITSIHQSTFGLQMVGEMVTVGGPQSKWRQFINLAENPEGGLGLMGLMCVCDVRVIPLVQSKWGQTNACGYPTYNYYSPHYYPCGCVATAMAQVMLYYEYPTVGVGVRAFEIEVNGVRQTAYTRGGNGSGEPYNWGDMILEPESNCNSFNETHRQAIGALCYDAGIAVEMEYESGGSGALMPDAGDALASTFQYSNVVWGYNSGHNIGSGLKEMINPNLDAKAPVILALSNSSDPNGGHAIICDGYGYDSSTLYHHLNMGWSGTDDAWYNLPDINTSLDKYISVFGCLYNIFTSGTGEIISGRILDPNGKPVVNATVYAEPGGRFPYMVLTNDRGIYAFDRLKSNTTYRVWPKADGYIFSDRSVETRRSRDESAMSGNRWGIDFYAEVVLNPPLPKFIFVDANAPGDPGPGDPAISDPSEDGSTEHPFDAIQQAIDVAVPGDAVVVLRGFYTGEGNRDLDFKGKAITVRSEDPNDPNLVIIDCNGTADNPHRGFEFHSYETPLSVLDGLTITGGYYERGGGIYCGDCARPTVINCTFRENSASLGGGMYNNSNPTLTNCTFSANSADGGGGIYNNGEESGCNPILNNCNFYRNIVSHNGGGMYNWGRHAKPALTNCQFIQNTVSSGGGGAMRNNQAGSPALTNCIFIGNSVATFGGGIRNSNGGSTTLTNCTFSENSASNGNSLACTPDDGGSQSPCGIRVANCILWDDGDEIFNNDNSTVTVAYSNVRGGGVRGPWPGEGNVMTNPYFADPNNGDYHLKSEAGRWDPNGQSWIQDEVTSPCIDAGDMSAPIGFESFPNGGIVNMGAYGSTAEASKSYFGTEVCETIVAGDINGDCKVDFADFALMAAHWLQER